MAVKHIVELFALDDRDFITEAYQNLLKREIDEHGLMYYLGRLGQGLSKADVIAQLAKSPECRPLDEIAGLKKLTMDTQRASSWFWRWFGRCGRTEAAIYTGTIKLAQLNTQLVSTNQHLASLNEALLAAANEHRHQIGHLAEQVEQVQINSPDSDQLQDKPRILSPETIRHIFMQILGRMPENTEILNQYSKSESPQSLRNELMRSGEFQSNLAGLPINARIIFMRRLHLQIARDD